jgi:hypothetical protein
MVVEWVGYLIKDLVLQVSEMMELRVGMITFTVIQVEVIAEPGEMAVVQEVCSMNVMDA